MTVLTDNNAPRVYLIRHGETAWSISGQHTSHTDISLTENGEEEARRLGIQLKGTAFAAVLTSPLHRARQTCALAGLDKAAEIETDLSEWDYGEYEGLRSVDIVNQRPNWSLFRDGCPNGEMPEQVLDRADRLIARLRLLHGNIALFSHGQFGSVLATRWIGLPLVNARHFPLDTGTVNVLGYDRHHPDVAVIAKWNTDRP
jgi:probable phosphoglycerate mutase